MIHIICKVIPPFFANCGSESVTNVEVCRVVYYLVNLVGVPPHDIFIAGKEMKRDHPDD
jgi:hypothetical protein